MTKIDAHIHFRGDHPEARALLEELGLKVLNICVASNPRWREIEAEPYQRLAQQCPDRFAWCTSFDVPDGQPNYADRIIAGLERDFAAGAVGCKVWKNIGMEVRNACGDFLMIDNSIFDPIFEYLAEAGKPLLMHTGEPLACWQPLSPDNPHYIAYSLHPEWHMYGRNDVPDHAAQIAARDRVIEKHPTLRVIGAHLGSLEYDVSEIARRFENYPNFAVDISARLADLVLQDSADVRRFFMEYSDRILFGTDVIIREPQNDLSKEERQKGYDWLRLQIETYSAYLETSGILSIEGREVQGLGLPADVLAKVYSRNARHWYSGL